MAAMHHHIIYFSCCRSTLNSVETVNPKKAFNGVARKRLPVKMAAFPIDLYLHHSLRFSVFPNNVGETKENERKREREKTARKIDWD